MSERFEADWLSLREAADAAARDPDLVGRASAWLADRPRPLAITDLGAGSGANPRFLAPRLPGPQRWRLVDHDAGLLARAADRLAGLRDLDGSDVQFEIRASDLA
ncbi:MAG: class I SAM-dependent methyltransferase, partial [Wenzhouxiangellaceae bacterium]|nr:class I SAM-dependent methyltransferase [Wenzhouxiangellaceae bacterium]